MYANRSKSFALMAVIALAAIAFVTLLAFSPLAAAGVLTLAPAAIGSAEELALELKTARDEFKTLHTTLTEQQTALLAELKAGKDFSTEQKKALDELMLKFTIQNTQVIELEQKMAAGIKLEEKVGNPTWGQAFVGSPAFKTATAAGQSPITQRNQILSHEIKAVTSSAAGGLIRSQREAGVVELRRERRVMRDLLNTVPVTTSSVEYATQTGRTNNAAPVAESAAKPYSDYTWGTQTVNIRVLAHLAKITRQAMEDAPRLVAEIDSEMRYGLGLVEERQFLYGSNVGQNLHGIVPQASAFDITGMGWVASALATRLDVLRLAILQLQVALHEPDGIVLNPIDWTMIELTKTTDGAYLFAQPQGTVSPRLWGLPVVATPAMLAGDFLVGDFRGGATVYDRMAVEVLISSENSDDFEKNLLTMRAEERVAIGVKRPGAFVSGDFAVALALLD